MSEYVFKLPDLGEGTVEAEIVEWHVKPGDVVAEGDIVADVMTDKANVEVPAPVAGTVLRTSGEPGDMVAVGAELMALTQASAVAGSAPARRVAAPSEEKQSSADARTVIPLPEEPVPALGVGAAKVADESPAGSERQDRATAATLASSEPPGPAARVRTSPMIRRRAKEAGVDLGSIRGTGPRGRILQTDFEAALAGRQSGDAGAGAAASAPDVEAVEEIKVIGVRRVIANRLQAAKREAPHFAFVEEVDITLLESLRSHLNQKRPDGAGLTYLPFISLALIRALARFPQCNAHFDSEAGVIRRFRQVHLGVATQTPDGLKVPVVHDAGSLSVWRLAAEIARVAEAARTGKATRAELTGSTITVTSLGRLGGIASTPVINMPEVAIIGVNKAVKRPMVVDDAVQVRLMMNLSSSFDHRFVDGFDGASLIAEIKSQLEEPATLFIDDP